MSVAVPAVERPAAYSAGPLRIELASRHVLVAGSAAPLPLSPQEFEVLQVIVAAWPRPVSRKRIAASVLREDVDEGLVDVVICRLRKRLPPDEHGRSLISTVSGQGWLMAFPVVSS